MKKGILIATIFLSLTTPFLASCAKDKEEIRIYAVIHDEEAKALTDLFTKKTGIPAVYIRATTGELVNRVIAEKNAPEADILLGGASSYHIQAAESGALEKYVSPVAKDIPAYAKAADDTWTGFCVLTLGIGVNTGRYTRLFGQKPLPATWDDLLDLDLEGEIVMTEPSASSTAYLFLQGQLQRLGWDKGWDYLTGLSALVGQFPESGSAPPKLVGTGEYAVGIAYLHALNKYKAQGFDITLVSPPRSVGDVDCISIMKGAKHLEQAKLFVDFMLSPEAQELMSSMDFTIPVNPKAKGAEGSIPVEQIDLIEYDTQKASREREGVLGIWAEKVR